MESVLPPMGLPGALLQDASDMILKGEYNAKLAQKFPVIGDFYKYYWNADKKKDNKTKSEKYKDLFKDWGD